MIDHENGGIKTKDFQRMRSEPEKKLRKRIPLEFDSRAMVALARKIKSHNGNQEQLKLKFLNWK